MHVTCKQTIFSSVQLDMLLLVFVRSRKQCPTLRKCIFTTVAQVLSESVANAFRYLGKEETVETERFVSNFDKFFDCLNVAHPTEWIAKKKVNRKPYKTVDDERLKVCSLKYCFTPMFKVCCFSGCKKIFSVISINGTWML